MGHANRVRASHAFDPITVQDLVEADRLANRSFQQGEPLRGRAGSNEQKPFLGIAFDHVLHDPSEVRRRLPESVKSLCPVLERDS